MSKTLHFTYLLPIHNEEPILEETVDVVARYLAGFPGSRIVLMENGSTDRSREIALRLEGTRHGVPVRALTLDRAGLGLAYRAGIVEALSDDDSWIVFGAADLPFGMSDLESFVRRHAKGDGFKVATGSKLHPDSRVSRTLLRAVLTAGFYLARRALLGMKTADCQGSVIIHASVLRALAGLSTAENYFFTTELVFFAERMGYPVVELPVVYAGEKRPSTVRPFYHSWNMLRQVVALRRRAAPALAGSKVLEHATT